MCYTQGAASRWSAERVRGEFPETNWTPGQPPSFTGEMIYPWMFDDYPGLRPLRDVAELLANDDEWPVLYDPAQLARNTVPAAAAIYAEDMYVPRALSEQTAGAIAGMKGWLTNEFEHSGLRTSDRVFERLLALVREQRLAARNRRGGGTLHQRCGGTLPLTPPAAVRHPEVWVAWPARASSSFRSRPFPSRRVPTAAGACGRCPVP